MSEMFPRPTFPHQHDRPKVEKEMSHVDFRKMERETISQLRDMSLQDLRAIEISDLTQREFEAYREIREQKAAEVAGLLGNPTYAAAIRQLAAHQQKRNKEVGFDPENEEELSRVVLENLLSETSKGWENGDELVKAYDRALAKAAQHESGRPKSILALSPEQATEKINTIRQRQREAEAAGRAEASQRAAAESKEKVELLGYYGGSWASVPEYRRAELQAGMGNAAERRRQLHDFRKMPQADAPVAPPTPAPTDSSLIAPGRIISPESQGQPSEVADEQND